jgi:hypothetical protein
MKRVILIFAVISSLFAVDNSDIEQKLNLILQKMSQLEKEVKAKDKEIEKLKKELQQKNSSKVEEKKIEKIEEKITLSNCKNIKVKDFSYKYHDEAIPYYELSYTLINNYPKKIVRLKGDLIVEDKDEVKLLQDYIDRKVDLAPKKSIKIKKIHTVTSDIEKELKGENPKNLKLIFEVIRADLADGGRIKCGIF